MYHTLKRNETLSVLVSHCPKNTLSHCAAFHRCFWAEKAALLPAPDLAAAAVCIWQLTQLAKTAKVSFFAFGEIEASAENLQPSAKQEKVRFAFRKRKLCPQSAWREITIQHSPESEEDSPAAGDRGGASIPERYVVVGFVH